MRSRLWPLIVLLFSITATGLSSSLDNSTSWKKETDRNDLEELMSGDVYILDARQSCKAGNVFGCIKGGAGSVILDLMNSVRDNFHDEYGKVSLMKTPIPRIINNEENLMKSSINERKSNSENSNDGLFGFITRATDRLMRSTGLVIELNDEITEHGLYKPRFIDEIYTEIDTLEDKNAKPNKRYEFKKLFIPLLLILKLFKLKLLVFLPILLGLASFKKIIALLILIVPGIIGYLKVCKPDLGHTYGTYGHSSFYNSPPSAKRKQYQEMMQQAYPYNDEDYGHNMAYQSYRFRHS
ncbi:hypothetical protein O3M35_012673 [Rhynocoris fuscipes]|uniref:Uncharacterized protein n=1 Tax=Rhynocoris fuscipes TaxID=488301 RepID=A0AAW1CVP9_9HEMI